MPLPEFTRMLVDKKIGQYCEARSPSHLRDQLRYFHRVRGISVTLYEARPHFEDRTRWTEIAFAQFRYDPKDGGWTLFCSDRNGRWHKYGNQATSGDLDDLLVEVSKDPTGIFWG